VLFFRKGDAGDLSSAGFGKIEAEATPAGTDVEHFHARFDCQFGSEVALLGELCVLKGGLLLLEIGAGVLAVTIEEQIIERAREIIVMGDVGFGFADRVVLVEPFEPDAEFVDCSGNGRIVRNVAGILQQDLEHLIDRALFDHEAAIHVFFANRQIRIEGDPAGGGVTGDADGHGNAGGIAIGVRPTRGADDVQRPLLHNETKCAVQ
jgi:hypothetical protein